MSGADHRTPVCRSDGITDAERYLKRLCDRSFLSLWSYSGVCRDQSAIGGSQGKEVCDLLVVFDDHVIIFSDKNCEFPDTGNLELDWRRWFRRAVMKSAKQIWGAERWMKSHPDRLFLDLDCTQHLPISIPDPSATHFHRIVVAHSATERCRAELGGSGSLMIVPGLVGEDHCASFDEGGRPFAVGQLSPAKGYVHIFDDISLGIVLQTLDTVTDFVSYLVRKEEFVCSGKLVAAAGEEDLLGYYLKHLNEHEEHDFVVPPEYDCIIIDEGLWWDFIHSPERRAQLAADQISYRWDALIESFSKHILENTQYYTTHPRIDDSERIIRFLARESRTRRRLLAGSLLELIERTPESYKATRVVLPSRGSDPYYIFLLLPNIHATSYAEYREVRRKLLEAYCLVTKLRFPDALDIVGIATETGLSKSRSEDALYLDARDWGAEIKEEATKLQRDLGLLTNTTECHTTVNEYPM